MGGGGRRNLIGEKLPFFILHGRNEFKFLPGPRLGFPNPRRFDGKKWRELLGITVHLFKQKVKTWKVFCGYRIVNGRNRIDISLFLSFNKRILDLEKK